MRIGIGYDSHRLVERRKLILGGVEIAHGKGLMGHSDADVLIHAVCDAILGALGGGDIGRHFPDTDPAYKGISSINLLRKVCAMAGERGFVIYNVDSTVIMEKPTLMHFLQDMAVNISEALHIAVDRVNVKAKTNEGMGFIGREEGIAALAVVTIQEKENP